MNHTITQWTPPGPIQARDTIGEAMQPILNRLIVALTDFSLANGSSSGLINGLIRTCREPRDCDTPLIMELDERWRPMVIQLRNSQAPDHIIATEYRQCDAMLHDMVMAHEHNEQGHIADYLPPNGPM